MAWTKKQLRQYACQWRQEHKKERLGYERNYRKTHPLNCKNSYIKYRYGIDLITYNKLVADSKGLCAICGQKESQRTCKGSKKTISIDHDHKTGKVRGFLCHNCNAALGSFKDSITILRKAIAYLEKR